jgi:SapC
MANIQIINNNQHKSLRCNPEYRAELGYGVGAIMVLPREIPEAQREYPILFRKHSETGALFPNLLLGFQQNENLFLSGDGSWTANHIPLSAAKGPFMITFQPDESGQNNPVVCVDLEDPRMSLTDGELLFGGDGQPTDYLNSISRSLLALHEGAHEIQKMVEAFLECQLLEPVTLDITFKNGEKISFPGAYTIPEEKLMALSAEKLHKLNQQGFLGLAHMISASLNNVKKLIEIKNRNY